MQVVDLQIGDESAVQNAATLLVKVAKDRWPGMTTALALEKVRQSSGAGSITLAAIDESGEAVGLISAFESVGKLWSLRLFVCNPKRADEVASLLKITLENRISERGGVTMQSFYETAQKSYLIGEFLDAEAEEPESDEAEDVQIYIGAVASSVQVYLSSKTAARATFFARLHGEAVDEWITRIVEEKLEAEETALVEAGQVFIK